MARTVQGPMIDETRYSVAVEHGGTGGRTESRARENLSLLAQTSIGVANGAVPLDDGGFVEAPYHPNILKLQGKCISGPKMVYENTVNLYRITDYDSRISYTTSTTVGTVSEVDEDGEFTLTVPSGFGTIQLGLNDRVVELDWVETTILPPVYIAPEDGAEDVSASISVEVEPMEVLGSDSITMDEVIVEASEDPVDFTGALVFTSDTLTVQLSLDIATTYYLRVRFLASNGKYSEWSEIRQISTNSGILEIQKLLASDPSSTSLFGSSVAISSDGSRIIIGSTRKNSGAGSDQGAAYVFARSGSTWVEEQKLLASDASSSNYFGRSAAISGDGSRVIVGASHKNSGAGANQGAAYIFVRSGSIWTEEQKLLPSDTAAGDWFGMSTSMSGDGTRVFIGARQKNSGAGANQGAAYVFVRSGSTWAEEQKLLPLDTAWNDHFGTSVSISSDGSRAVIGAYNKNGGAGAAYIFVRSGTTWIEEEKLLPSDTATGDWFAESVSISSDGAKVVIGARRKNSGFSNQGAAYVFSRSGSTWTEKQKVLASDPAADSRFGKDVSISDSGTRMIVGAYEKNSGAGIAQGAAYVFSLSGSTWTEEQKLLLSDAAANDQFGESTTISSDGSILVIGATGKNSGAGSYQGAAYIFA